MFKFLNPKPQNPHIMIIFKTCLRIHRYLSSTPKPLNATNTVLTSSLNPPKTPPPHVLEFLKKSGFEDAHIDSIASKRPSILSSDIEKTLIPKFSFFHQLGLSGAPFALLISKNPSLLSCSVDNHLRPNADLLRSLLPDDKSVMRAITRSSWLLCFHARKVILPNVQLLRSCGITDRQITTNLLRNPRLFTQNHSWYQELIERVEKFGLKTGSPMFFYAIYSLGSMSKTTFAAKIKMFKSLGWNEEDIATAFRKDPMYLTLSESKVRRAMCFFVDDLGYEPSKIASRPMLFRYSLTKRLMPRREFLSVLKMRGLLKRDVSLYTAASFPESLFCEKYVLKYVDEAPDLHDVYIGILRKYAGDSTENTDKVTALA